MSLDSANIVTSKYFRLLVSYNKKQNVVWIHLYDNIKIYKKFCSNS